MNHTLRFTVAASLALFSAGHLAAADDAADPNPPGIVVTAEHPANTLPTVGSTLGLSTDDLSLPLSTTVIGGSLNAAQGNRTLKDALRNSAGATVGTGNGLHDFFVIRGFDSLNGGLVTIDGIAEPEATFYHLQGIEAVQVIRGPGAFRFGPGSLGSTVNLVRKQPVDDTFASLRIGVGSHSLYSAGLDTGSSSEDAALAFRLNLFAEDRESHRDGIEGETFQASPIVRWQASENDTVTLYVDYATSDVTPDAGIPLLGPARITDSKSANFQAASDYSEQTVVRAGINLEHRFDNETRLRNKTYYSELEWDTQGTVFAGFVLFGIGLESAPLTLSRYQPSLDDTQRIIGNELEFAFETDALGATHELIVGAEFTRYADEFVQATDPISDLNIATGMETPGILPPLPVNAGDAKTDLAGLYLMDHATWDDGLAILGGVRVDWMDFEDSLRGTSNSETLISPFGGIVYDLNESVALFANAGQGYTPPSTLAANSAGDPEESEQVEAGISFADADGKWSGRVAVYEITRDKIGIPSSSGLITEQGKQKSQGAELELSAKASEHLTVRFAYAFLESELDRFSESLGGFPMDYSGNTAPFAPKHSAQLWTEYQVSQNLGIGLGARGLSEQFIAPDNSYEIDDYATLDAALLFRQPSWRLSVHLKNLTEEDYETRGVAGTSVIPEDGFSALAYLELDI